MTDRPAGYDPDAHPRVAVTVDVVVLTVRDDALQALLVRRGGPPYEGHWALPGGFVRPDEDLDTAAARELREETAVEAAPHLVQVGTYGAPDRDPRMRVVTVAYLAVLRDPGPIAAGSDAADAALVGVADLLGARPARALAFDHAQILADAVERARADLETTSLAAAFVGPEFTLSELRGVYEAAWGERLDAGNFRRKVLAARLAEPTGETAPPGPEGGKPAELFTQRSVQPLDAPIRRPRRRSPD